MSHYIASGVFGHYFVTMVLIISTLYGLNYYYQGYDYGSQISTYETKNTQTFWDIMVVSTVDGMLEILSILNPFILIKLFLFDKLDFSTFQAFNLFILRPIGWVALWMEAEFIINKIRGISG